MDLIVNYLEKLFYWFNVYWGYLKHVLNFLAEPVKVGCEADSECPLVRTQKFYIPRLNYLV